MQPTVSIIIPTYNREDLIERAVRSVLEQTFEDLECIVVDDLSTDGTAAKVESIEDERLTLISHDENRGAAAARNTGIQQASGEYIAFLDDDDIWRPEKLKKQMDCLQSAPRSVGLVYCWMDYYDNEGDLIREYHPELRGDIFLNVLDKQRIGNSSTLVAPATVVEEVDGFDPAIPRGDDGDFIRRVARKYDVDYVPEVLVEAYVDHGHRRITAQDDQGFRDGIEDQRIKIKKFENELCENEEKFAIVESIIARRYIQLGEYAVAAKYFCRAFRKAPTTSNIYKELYRGLRYRINRRLF